MSFIKNILIGLQKGEVSLDETLRTLENLPYEDLGHSRLDHHRELRQGVAEVIYAEHKTEKQVADIASALLKKQGWFLATRVSEPCYRYSENEIPSLQYDADARVMYVEPSAKKEVGLITVISAGTSDYPVAREAALTASLCGNKVKEINDCGVAGLHRVLDVKEQLAQSRAIIAIAGMDGVLPGLIASLVKVPVIAVPTDCGYGASFGGVAPLLTMLNSCASGLTVVNINNGFGAAIAAHRINQNGERSVEV